MGGGGGGDTMCGFNYMYNLLALEGSVECLGVMRWAVSHCKASHRLMLCWFVHKVLGGGGGGGGGR